MAKQKFCNECEYYKPRIPTVKRLDGSTSYGDGKCLVDKSYTQAKFNACPMFEPKKEL